MKKADYVKNTQKFNVLHRRISAWLWLSLTLTIGLNIFAWKFLFGSEQIFTILIGGCLSVLLITYLLIKTNFISTLSSVQDKIIWTEKFDRDFDLVKIRMSKHQHEAIADKINRLIKYAGKDKLAMEALKMYLKKTDFSYLFTQVKSESLRTNPCLYEIIGDTVEEFISLFRTCGWGDYTRRLRGQIKLKIHAEEMRQIKAATLTIEQELIFINALEN